MSQYREKKLFPSTDNSQCQDPDVPWRKFATYMESLVAGLPPDEQATVVVSGAGNLDIRYLTKISDYALAIELKRRPTGERIEVTPDEAVTCEDEGGCYLLTVKVLRAFAERFHQVGYEHCRSESKDNT